MNIDRYAVTLFLEIKRNLPHGIAHTLKIANPQLEQEMAAIYNCIENEDAKTLIEVFIDHINKAKPDSSKVTKRASKINASTSAITGRLSSLIPKVNVMFEATPKKPSQRYYRGVLIEDK